MISLDSTKGIFLERMYLLLNVLAHFWVIEYIQAMVETLQIQFHIGGDNITLSLERELSHPLSLIFAMCDRYSKEVN